MISLSSFFYYMNTIKNNKKGANSIAPLISVI